MRCHINIAVVGNKINSSPTAYHVIECRFAESIATRCARTNGHCAEARRVRKCKLARAVQISVDGYIIGGDSEIVNFFDTADNTIESGCS